MIDPIESGSPFDEIKKIQKEIDAIKSMKDKVRNRINRDLDNSMPDFDQVLERKQSVEGTGAIDRTIEKTSKKHGLDSDLVRSVIEVESGFDPNAVSEDGAKGMMQLMPDTAAEMGVDPDDPAQNIKGGTEYLAKQIDEFGNVKEALAAYNAGPGAVKQHGGVPPFPETENYVKQVIDTFRSYKKKQ
jgi:soluble lytic murein transglycosylase-like protein